MAPRTKKGGSAASEAVENLVTPQAYRGMMQRLGGGGKATGVDTIITSIFKQHRGGAAATRSLDAALDALSPKGVVALHKLLVAPNTMQGGMSMREAFSVTPQFAETTAELMSKLKPENIVKAGSILVGPRGAQAGGMLPAFKDLMDVASKSMVVIPPPIKGGKKRGGGDATEISAPPSPAKSVGPPTSGILDVPASREANAAWLRRP